MTVQYIDISYEIWDKNIVDLKGNTTVKKQIHVVGNLVKVPREIIKLHKDVFVTADIIFVNGIPFFILLSRNIIFTMVNHLTDSKSNTLFKSPKWIYMYYIKRGFIITTLHVDGEFVKLQ